MTDPRDLPGAVTADDVEVLRALGVWDNLTPGEQRETFRTIYAAMTASGRTHSVDPLLKVADSVRGMVRLESQHPGARDMIRATTASRPPADPDEGISLDEVVKELREA